MNHNFHMQRYQNQAIFSASPEQLITKLYDIAISACHREDRVKLRRVLQELLGSLNFEEGGEIAERLSSIYTFCMEASVQGDLSTVLELMSELRDVWKDNVVSAKAA